MLSFYIWYIGLTVDMKYLGLPWIERIKGHHQIRTLKEEIKNYDVKI